MLNIPQYWNVLNEYYYGPSAVQKLEDFIDSIMKELQFSNRAVIPNTNISINIGSILDNIFGFAKTNVYIRYENQLLIGTDIRRIKSKVLTTDYKVLQRAIENVIDDDLILDPYQIDKTIGLKFKPKVFPIELYVYINGWLLTNPQMSAKNIVGLLLHEIGHNFYEVYLRLLLDSDNLKTRYAFIYKFANKDAKRSTFLTNIAAEKFADQFAAMYGYSRYHYDALQKLQSDSETIQLMRTKNDLTNLIHSMNTEDEHPFNITRLQGMLLQLRYDLYKQDFDPSHKEQLLSDIEELQNRLVIFEKDLHSKDENTRSNMNKLIDVIDQTRETMEGPNYLTSPKQIRKVINTRLL